MAIKQVVMIQANTTTGQVKPLRFRIAGRSIDIDRIITFKEEKSAGFVWLVYEAESIVDDRLHRYKLKFDTHARKWYFIGGPS